MTVGNSQEISMNNLGSALEAQRTAADAFRSAVLAVAEAAWNVPREPGKWSPAQVADHAVVSTRVARAALAGTAGIRGIPRVLRWLARIFYFDKVVVKGFPRKGKGPPAFAPAQYPAPRAQLIAGLAEEVAAFAAAARTGSEGGRTTFEHGFFGRIAIADYVLFNARHLEHHRAQLPGTGPSNP
jgi:DinB superfamily